MHKAAYARAGADRGRRSSTARSRTTRSWRWPGSATRASRSSIAQQGKAPRRAAAGAGRRHLPARPQLRVARALPRRDADVHHRRTWASRIWRARRPRRSACWPAAAAPRAWDTLIAIGDPSVDPVRAPIALAVAARRGRRSGRRCSARWSARPIRRRRCCSCATASTCSPRISPRSASTRASAPSTGRRRRARRRAPRIQRVMTTLDF